MRLPCALCLLALSSTAFAAEVEGRVVKVEKHRLLLNDGKKLIPLELTPQTSVVADAPLSEGTQVRASFTVDLTENLARRVEAVRAPEPTQPANPRSPVLVPDVGETKGPGSPLP